MADGTAGIRNRAPSGSPASAVESVTDRDYCDAMLPKVSRTFALCIRLLPPDLEHPVLIAYLLCRIADTIEDTADLDVSEKGRLLHHLQGCLEENGPAAGPIAAAFTAPRSDEEELAYHTDAVLRSFRALPGPQRHAVAPWVKEMCGGMAGFASGNDSPQTHGLRALRTEEDLNRYCYFVAGTVGHLLTDLFAVTRARVSPAHHQRLKRLATSFGLGLQLTNIIKDVADDRRRGWSFVPEDVCRNAGIRPEDLHDPQHRQAARRVMDLLIRKAQGHLADALSYCTTVPRREYRIRLFCLTSMYFAVRTLRLARTDPRVLEANRKLKITRGAVYRTVGASVAVAPSNAMVRRYFSILAGPAVSSDPMGSRG